MNARRGYENRSSSGNNGNVREERPGGEEGRTKVFKQLIPQVPSEIPVNSVCMGKELYARFEDLGIGGTEAVFYDCPVVSFVKFESVKDITHPNGKHEEIRASYMDPFVWVDIPKKGVDAGFRLLSNIDPFAFDHEKRGSGPLGLAFRGMYYEDGEPFVKRLVSK